MKRDPETLRFAASEVAKLSELLVGNIKTDGSRDPLVYEQGIGCELASKMLLEEAKLLEVAGAKSVIPVP